MNEQTQFNLSFVAVGPQRTGSTWLHQVIENHPAIGLPVRIKETMFFDQYYHKGIDWLVSHYALPVDAKHYGEVAPTYFASNIALERIKSHYPDCKIFINVRNPVQHAYSVYLHELSKGRIAGELADIIKNCPERLRPGTYSDWIPRWQEAFGVENVCLVWTDQIEGNPQGVYKDICDFLGVSSDHYLQSVGGQQVNASKKARFPRLTRFGISVYHLLREYRLHSVINFCKRIHLDKITFSTNKGSARIKPDQADLKSLLTLYSADIGYLEQMSGQDLSSWKNIGGEESDGQGVSTNSETVKSIY